MGWEFHGISEYIRQKIGGGNRGWIPLSTFGSWDRTRFSKNVNVWGTPQIVMSHDTYMVPGPRIFHSRLRGVLESRFDMSCQC